MYLTSAWQVPAWHLDPAEDVHFRSGLEGSTAVVGNSNLADFDWPVLRNGEPPVLCRFSDRTGQSSVGHDKYANERAAISTATGSGLVRRMRTDGSGGLGKVSDCKEQTSG
ncbi:hypothetical protein VTN77DRAFT_3200 [Rasamsonia byssochlamydoides]|uniref:uncharacterized protein n=1 Tax=Rasamsonia byssochlamydoides TaxID=89139 RepID=UPI0037423C74